MSEPLKDSASNRASSSQTQVPGNEADIRSLLRQAPEMDLDQVVELLQLDQVRRWRQGQRVPAEAYLQLYPPLSANSDVAFDLVYGEYLLRKELGETPAAEEYRWRFPQYAEQLDRQVALDASLDEDADDATTEEFVARSRSGAPEENQFGAVFDLQRPKVPGYEILEELGRGGMGVVYKARQAALGRLVALKIIRAGSGADPSDLGRFLNEARAAARLQHPHVVQVHEIGTHAGQPYIALEFVDGGSLADLLSSRPLPPRESAHLVAVLADTMHAAHQQGIVHRDLKPANILLRKVDALRTKDGSDSVVILHASSFMPKVADFGLAKQLPGHAEAGSGAATLTQTGMVLGTPQFMAPEQAAGRTREVGPLSDVYALGAIMYASLTGRAPFVGAQLDVMLQVLEEDPVPLRRLNASVPRELETVCLKCLSKDPRKRYASARDLADDLRRYLQGKPVLARPTGIAERAWKWAKRRPAVASVFGVTALALVVLLIGALYYNAQLRRLLSTAQGAEQRADANAQVANVQRGLALEALQKLVFEVQEQLRDTPATRAMRERLLNTALKGLRQLADSAEAADPDASRAAAHQQLGLLFFQVGRVDDSQRQHEFAAQISTTVLGAEPNNQIVRGTLCQAHLSLGQVALSRNDAVTARDHDQQAVELAEAWTRADPTNAAARKILADAYDRLTHAHLWLREVKAAQDTLDKSLHHVQNWVEAEPTDLSAKYFLGSVYNKRAKLAEALGDRVAERESYLQESTISRELVAADPGSRSYKRSLLVVLNNLGAIALDGGNISEARSYIEQSVNIIRELATVDPDAIEPQLDLLDGLYNLGMLGQRAEHHAEAAATYQEALDRIERLERAGKLKDRPLYGVERKEMLKQELAFCKLADSVVKDPAVAKAQMPNVAAELLVYRIRVLVRSGHLADVSVTADALCKIQATHWDELLHIAQGCALSSELVASTQAKEPANSALKDIQENCAARAVEALRQATAAGFKDARRLENEPDLAPLRQRKDFQELVRQLKKSA